MRNQRIVLKRMIIGVILLAFFIGSPFFQVVKSYSVMSVYSFMHEQKSFLHEDKIKIAIPGGLTTFKRDYYPFVMTYDTTEEFSNYRNEPVDLVIMYNFGAMKWLKGSSLMYDSQSPYYSAFYGAYAARYGDASKQYGMNTDGSLNIEEIMDVTDFDLKHLVLNSIGDYLPELNYQLVNEADVAKTTEIDGIVFTVIDAELTMNGMWHEYTRDFTAYIQYGRPPKMTEKTTSFQSINAYGRIYIHFDQKSRISYFFYIIAPKIETLIETENNFILKSTIKLND